MAVGPPPKASRKGSPALVSCSAALSNFEAKISKASPPLSAVFCCVVAARLSNCSSGLYASLVGNSAPGIGLVDLAPPVLVGSPKSPSKSEAKGPLDGRLISEVVNKDCAADICMGVENGAITVSAFPNGAEGVVSATEKNVDSVTDVDNCSVVENNSLPVLDDRNVSPARSISTLSVSLPTAPVVDETEGLFSLATDTVS